MNKERLLKLADYLETVDESKFNMRNWAEKTEECGTVCCAAGHATMIPEFAAEGFRLITDKDNDNITTVAYQGRISFKACEAFFDLSTDECNALFVWYYAGDNDNPWGEDHYTISEVVRHIRQLVAGEVVIESDDDDDYNSYNDEDEIEE